MSCMQHNPIVCVRDIFNVNYICLRFKLYIHFNLFTIKIIFEKEKNVYQQFRIAKYYNYTVHVNLIEIPYLFKTLSTRDHSKIKYKY